MGFKCIYIYFGVCVPPCITRRRGPTRIVAAKSKLRFGFEETFCWAWPIYPWLSILRGFVRKRLSFALPFHGFHRFRDIRRSICYVRMSYREVQESDDKWRLRRIVCTEFEGALSVPVSCGGDVSFQSLRYFSSTFSPLIES